MGYPIASRVTSLSRSAAVGAHVVQNFFIATLAPALLFGALVFGATIVAPRDASAQALPPPALAGKFLSRNRGVQLSVKLPRALQGSRIRRQLSVILTRDVNGVPTPIAVLNRPAKSFRFTDRSAVGTGFRYHAGIVATNGAAGWIGPVDVGVYVPPAPPAAEAAPAPAGGDLSQIQPTSNGAPASTNASSGAPAAPQASPGAPQTTAAAPQPAPAATPAPKPTAAPTPKPTAAPAPAPTAAATPKPTAVPAPTATAPSVGLSCHDMPLPAGIAECLPGFEEEVIRQTNSQRQAIGVAPVSANRQLNCAARTHTIWMISTNQFSHTGWDSSIIASGFSGQPMGQNIAQGYSHPNLVMTAWMNSSGHRAAILNASHEDIGVACLVGPGNSVWWTQDYGAH